jgi:hypothetical protein
MADLVDFEVSDPPRAPDVCKHYVRRIEPLWGFVVYGVLWYFVAFVAFAIGCAPGFLLGNAVGAKGALWVTVLGLTGGGIAFLLAWIPFVRWAKRRRARTLPLIRDGVLLEGSVFNNMSGPGLAAAGRIVTDFAVGQLGVKFYRVTVEHEGMPHMLHVPNPTFGGRPAPGTTLPVLFHPDVAHALVFDQRGKANVARVR